MCHLLFCISCCEISIFSDILRTAPPSTQIAMDVTIFLGHTPHEAVRSNGKITWKSLWLIVFNNNWIIYNWPKSNTFSESKFEQWQGISIRLFGIVISPLMNGSNYKQTHQAPCRQAVDLPGPRYPKRSQILLYYLPRSFMNHIGIDSVCILCLKNPALLYLSSSPDPRVWSSSLSIPDSRAHLRVTISTASYKAYAPSHALDAG